MTNIVWPFQARMTSARHGQSLDPVLCGWQARRSWWARISAQQKSQLYYLATSTRTVTNRRKGARKSKNWIAFVGIFTDTDR